MLIFYTFVKYTEVEIEQKNRTKWSYFYELLDFFERDGNICTINSSNIVESEVTILY